MVRSKNHCPVCSRKVATNHRAICCDKCDCWIHIKCNQLDARSYEYLKNSHDNWYCMKCLAEVVPFSALDDENCRLTLQGKNHIPHYLTPVPDCQLMSLYEKIKTMEIDENINDLIDDDNYDKTISEMNSVKSKPSLSMIHLNIASLPFHIDELDSMINTIDQELDLIGISETKLNNLGSTNISLKNYTYVHCMSESSKGGTLLYVSDKHSYHERQDLQVYKAKELESIFIEIDQQKGKNIIVGCIYRHPNMSVEEFNKSHLTNLLRKLKKEQKSKDIYLMGDFNINLINYNSCEYSQEFVDLMASSELLPLISAPYSDNKQKQNSY